MNTLEIFCVTFRDEFAESLSINFALTARSFVKQRIMYESTMMEFKKKSLRFQNY